MSAPPITTGGVGDAVRTAAWADFLRMIRWIAVAGVLMVVAALAYLSSFGPMTVTMVVATIGGVFVSVLLGCGLFAAGFFSDKSGHDAAVTAATVPRPAPLRASTASPAASNENDRINGE